MSQKTDWFSYEIILVRRAYLSTLGFFGLNRKSLFVALVSFMLGVPIFSYIRDWEAVWEEILVAVSFIVLPFGIFAIGLFIWNLIRAPYILYKEQQDEINSLKLPLGVDVEMPGEIILVFVPKRSLDDSQWTGAFFLATELAVTNRSDTKSVIEINLRVMIGKTHWLLLASESAEGGIVPIIKSVRIDRGIPMGKSLERYINLDARTGDSGHVAFSISKDEWEFFSATKLEQLRTHDLCFEVGHV